MEEKVIRDNVHGYIYINKDIMNSVIDTPLFQRLRRIEQTSMRCLYPSARHDRFIHSIGTYYLAHRISTSLKEKLKIFKGKGSFNFSNKLFKKLRINFEFAAILHDIGHSPFSHTLENYFKLEKSSDGPVIYSKLIEAVKDLCDVDIARAFEIDFSKSNPAPHEIVSATIAIKEYGDQLKKLCETRGVEADYDFIVRAITGTVYADDSKGLENCFINLLNSSAIDIDKLDYIVRDSQISGYDNVKIDIERLISSICPLVYKDDNDCNKLILVYDKTALSVIQNVVNCRNSLYTWIYSHHKVLYEVELVNQAIRLIAKKLNPANPNDFICKLFSLDSIVKDYLCDDDIWCLFKKNMDIEPIYELFDRRRQKTALWKSFSEFNLLFSDTKYKKIGAFDEELFKSIAGSDGEAAREFKKYINRYNGLNIDSKAIKSTIKLSSIEHKAILIKLGKKIYSYDQLMGECYPIGSINNFLYLYVDKEVSEKIDVNKLAAYIRNYPKFRTMPK